MNYKAGNVWRLLAGWVLAGLVWLIPVQVFATATVNLSYSPATINPGDADVLTISLFNDSTLNGLNSAAITLSLPTGVTVAAIPAAVDTCSFSSVSVPANGSLIILSGGTVPQATTTTGTCTLSFAIKSVAAGNHPTSIPAGPVVGFTAGGTTPGFSAVDNGSNVTNSTPATATLAVNSLSNLTGTSTFSPSTVYAAELTRLSVVLNNPNATVAVPLSTFTDTFPAGMVIAPTANATITCTGAGNAGTLATPSGAGTAVVAGDTSITLTGGSIAGGGSCTLAVNVVAPGSTGSAASRSYADSPGAIGNARGLSGTPGAASLTVSSPVSISQSVSPSTVYSSEASTLTITITNASSTNALSIASFTDTVTGPGTITLGAPSVTCAGGTAGTVTAVGGTLTLTGAVAAAGATCAITVGTSMTGTGTITSSSSGTSPATAMSTTGAGTVFVPSSSRTLAVITPATVTHTFSGGTLYTGDTTTLTITVTNASTANTLNITSLVETLSGPGAITINGTPTVTCTGGTAGSVSVSGSVITLTGAVANVSNGTCVITASVSMALDGTYSSTTSASPGTAMSNGVAPTLSVTNTTNPRTKAVSTPITVSQSFTSSTGGNVRVGQPSTLTVTLNNASSASAVAVTSFTVNITGTDGANAAVPSGQLSVSNLSISCTGTGAINGTATVDANRVITISGAVIGTGGHCTLTGSAAMGVAGTLKSNSTASSGSPAAQLTSTAISPTNFTVAASSASVPVISQFTITKTISSTPGYLGMPLNYTITINNWSGGAANNVSFTDNLPNPVGGQPMVVSDTGSALGAGCSGGTFTATPGASTVTWTGGTIVSGSGIGPGVCNITIASSMPADSATGVSYVNTLPINTSVTGLDVGGNALSNSNQATVSVLSAAAVTIAQAYGASIKQFGSSQLTFTLNNPTTTTLTGLGFSEALNAALSIAPNAGLITTCGGTPTYTAVPGTSAFSVSGLTVNASTNCTVKVNVTASTVGAFASTIPAGNISSNEGQTNSTSASATLTVTSALTGSAAFLPTSTGLHGSSRLTVTVNNGGAVALSNVSVTAPLGSGANTYVLASTPAASSTCAGNPAITAPPGSASIAMTGATLAAGASCTLSFDVLTSTGGPWSLNIPAGNVTSAEGANTTANLTASLSLTTSTAIGVNKSFSPNSITGGSPSVLQIDFSNPLGSSGAVSGLGITDNLPNGMVVYANPNASTTCAGGTVAATAGGSAVTLSGASLPVNATCSVLVNVTSLLPANLTNVISAGAVTTRQGFTNSVSTSATLSTLQGLGVLKSFSPAAVAPNQVSHLTIQLVSTLTTISLNGVAVTDTLPTGLVIAPTPNVVSTCNITPTATGGANSIAVSGVTLAPSSSCTVQVDVVAATTGTYTNTIPVGGAISTQGYGNQTAAIATLIVMPAPTVTLAFGTNPVKAGTSSTATVTVTNTSSTQALSASALTFNLPAGLSVAATTNANTTCSGGTATAVAAGNSVALTGGTIAPSGSCTLRVDVFSNTPASYVGTVAAGALSTAQGISNAAAANATLVVLQLPTVTQSLSVANILPAGTSRLTITLGNSNAAATTLSSVFTNTLPVSPGNMVIATPNGLTTTCTAGSVTAVAGAGTISYASGASLPANGGCTISVNVTASTLGTYNNAIPAGALVTAAGTSQTLSTTSLVVATSSPPTANAVTSGVISANASSAQVLPAMSGTAAAGGATITGYTVLTLPTAGSLYCNSVAVSSVPTNCAAGGLSFLPSGTTPNPVTFTYTVTDSNGTTSISALFSIPIGAPPVAVAFSNSVNNNATSTVAIGPMAGTGQNGATIASYTVTVLPANASLFCNSAPISSVPSACAAGALRILPVGNPSGTSTLSYTVTDSNGSPSTAVNGTITWNVPPVAMTLTNSPIGSTVPQAVTLSAMSGTSVSSGVTIISFHIASLPANGTLYCNNVALSSVPAGCGANLLSYLPGASPPVSVSFTYTVTDSNGMVSAPATFTVPVSVGPVAAAFSVRLNNNSTVPAAIGTMSATVQTGLTVAAYTVTSLPPSATLQCAGTPVTAVPASCAANALTALPVGRPTVASTFTYTATDSNSQISTAATITIQWNVPPVATSGLTSTIDPALPGVQALAALAGTTANVGATITTYTVVTLPTAGTLYCGTTPISAVPTSCAAGSLGMTSGGIAFTAATFTFTVTDSLGVTSDPATFTVGSAASPALYIAMTIGSQLTVGFNATYSIQVSNASATTATSAAITVTDVLPAGLDYVSASGPGWTCSWNTGNHTSTCVSSAVLAPNALAPAISLVVRPNLQAVPSGTTATITDTSVVAGGGESAAYANETAPGARPHSATVSQTVGLAAVISGQSWVDLNHNGVLDSNEPTPAANTVRVEVWPAGTTLQQAAGGTPLAATPVDASGRYSVSVPAGNVQIRFVDVASSATLGMPVNGDTSASRNQSSITGSNGVISHGVIENIVLTAGATVVEQSLPIDPQGIVYDSGTRQPVGGASVSLMFNGALVPSNCLVGGANPFVTNSNGATAGLYQFLLDFAATGCASYSGGNFTLAVSAPGYTFPSRVIFPGNGTVTVLTTPAGAGVFAVVPQSTAPLGADPTTHYLQLVLSSTAQGIANNHLPVDGLAQGQVNISKTASKPTAEIGDTVRYTVTLRNSGNGIAPQGVVTDRLPLGFKWLRDSASWSVAGSVAPVTPTVMGNQLFFASPAIAPGATASLVYVVRIGVGADRGDGVNHAYAVTGSARSNEATAAVKVSGGVFGVSACIVGKVFEDCEKTGLQQESAKGLAGIRIYMETGLSVTTDADGKFSVCGVQPRTHALKLDTSTLPRGALTVITSNRNLGDANSLLLDVKNGELMRADFAVDVCSTAPIPALEPDRQAPPLTAPSGGIVFRSKAISAQEVRP